MIYKKELVKEYFIFLLGSGTEDLNAENKIPLDFSKTVISKTEFSTVAGSPEQMQFTIEARTTNNKRKNDANVDFTFSFTQNAKPVDDKFSIGFIDGKIKGTYLVGFTSTLAGKSTLLITMINKENGSKQQLSQALTVSVKPAGVNSIEILTALKDSNADSNYVIEVMPYDKFKNIAEETDKEVNLKLAWPENPISMPSYTANKDVSTGKITYTIVPRMAGKYTLSSYLLANSQSFSIAAGTPIASTSSITLSANEIIVDNELALNVYVFDQYKNQIDCQRADLKTLVKLSVAMNQAASETLALTADQKTNSLFFGYKSQKTGTAKFKLLVSESQVSCEPCQTKFTCSNYDLSHSKLYV